MHVLLDHVAGALGELRQIDEALLVCRQERGDVDQPRDAVRPPDRGLRDRHAAHGMRHEHDRLGLLGQDRPDPLDVGVERHVGDRRLVLAAAREVERLDVVSGGRHLRHQRLPAPRAVERTVDEDESRHACSLSRVERVLYHAMPGATGAQPARGYRRPPVPRAGGESHESRRVPWSARHPPRGRARAGRCAPGSVKVKVDWCGICGTDLHEYLAGPIFIPPPGSPAPDHGRDAAAHCSATSSRATVVDVGAGRRARDRDGRPRSRSSPCFRCGDLHGVPGAAAPNLCEQLGFYGLMGGGGGMSEFAVMPSYMVHGAARRA